MKILVVDDDPQNREILRIRLEQAGYEVAEAANGEEGVERALQGGHDLILLDIMMPKKDGWQVCKAVKAHPKTRQVPVIVLTARSQNIDGLRTWESGADDYLTKPVEPARLLEAVGNLLKSGGAHGAD